MTELMLSRRNGQEIGRAVHMRIRIASAFAVAVLLTTGCAKPPKQAVGVSAGLKESIEKTVLAKGYAIYATGHPARDRDLADTVLFSCGCTDDDIDERLMASFYEGLGEQVFRSSEEFKVVDKVSCPGSDACMTVNETLNLHLSHGGWMVGGLKRISKFYGRSTSRSALIGKCLERARAVGRSVIIVPADSPIRSGDGMVELMFEPTETTSGVVIKGVMQTITLEDGKPGSGNKNEFRTGRLTILLFDGEQVEADATAEQVKQYLQGARRAKLRKTSDGRWTVVSLEAPSGKESSRERPEDSQHGGGIRGPDVQESQNPAAVLFRLPGKEAEQLLIRRVNPIYPPLARRARIQGTVIIDLSVSEGGTVSSARLINGHPLLTEAAIQAASGWIYKPYTEAGKPKAFVTTVNIPFSLN